MVLIKQDLKDILQKAEFIVGTHGSTATNVWTGTSTTINNLKTGQVIYFQLSSAGTSTGATLNLTLANGTTTGAKAIYYNNTTVLTTQYGIGAVICLVYDGTAWRVSVPYTNSNYYDRLIYGSQIVAGETLSNYTLVYGRKDKKYYTIASNGLLDIKHPILYLGANLSSGGNSSNVYSVYQYGVNLATTKSGHTHTNYREVFLEGVQYSNGEFRISSNVFVDEDHLTKGNYYIKLGGAYSTTNIRFVSDMTVYKYDGYNLTIAENSDVQEGGRNLVPYTQEFTQTTGTLTSDYYNGCRVRNYDNTSGSANLDCTWNLPTVGDFTYGDYYTLSFWAKGTGTISAYSYGNTNYIGTKTVHYSSGGIPKANTYGDGGISWSLTTSWRRYYVTWHFNPTSSSTQLDTIIKKLLIRLPTGSEADVCGVMFEKGEVAHDWSPCPDDKISKVSGNTNLLLADGTTKAQSSFSASTHNHDSDYIKTGTGTVTSTNILNGTIVNDDIANTTIQGGKLVDSTITGSKIANNTIPTSKLQYYSSYGGGTNGTAGYVKMMSFKITGTYYDRALYLEITQRHNVLPRRLSIRWKTGSFTNNDAPLLSVLYDGGNTGTEQVRIPKIYLYKESTATWSLIVQKSEGHDTVTVRMLNAENGFTVTNIGTLLTELPQNTTNNPLVEAIQINPIHDFIVSNHASGTNNWTGVSDKLFALEKGTVIYFNLKQAPVNANATLNITFPDGTTSGAKTIYFNGSNLKQQYPNNSLIGMVFDGTNWIVISNYTNTNTTYSADNSTLQLSSTTFSVKDSGVTLAKLNSDVYDSTSGGTSGSSKLITSGAVYSGLSGKAPTSHASTSTTYGRGSATNYGHAKAFNGTTTAIGTTASNGTDDGIYARGDHTHNITKATVTGLGISSSDHVHGNITNDGKVGSNANYFLYTGTGGAVTSKQKIGNITTSGAIGTTSGNVITTTTNGVLQSSTSINSDKVTDNTASSYTNIGSMSNGATQKAINTNINSKMGALGTWTDIIDDVIDWNHTTTIGSYSHCWYNESLQMILFRFHYPFMSMQSATKYTWNGQGNTPGKLKVKNEYKPLSLIYGSAVASRGDDAGLGSIWVNSDGYFGGIFNKTFANTGTEVQVYGTIIWVLTEDISE